MRASSVITSKPTMDCRHRVFFALWPEPTVREAAIALRAAYAAAGRDVPAAHLHLTLAFAGNVDTTQLAALRNAGDSGHVPPFALSLDRLDGFAAARVQWLGPSAPPTALGTLARQLQQRCRDAGIALPDEAFRPHMTLRRRVSEPERKAVPAITWRPRDFALIESGSAGQPGAYRVLARWPLVGGD